MGSWREPEAAVVGAYDMVVGKEKSGQMKSLQEHWDKKL